MNLHKAILEEHSKAQTQKIVQWIGNDAERTKMLVDIFLYGTYPVVQRAAWIVSSLADKHPELIQPYVESLLHKAIDKGMHVAVKRNVFRIFQQLDLPETIHSTLMNSCFDALLNAHETLAVRVFAMSILARLFLIYPEIGNELRIIIEDTLQQAAAPSFKSRAKKVLRQLQATNTNPFI